MEPPGPEGTPEPGDAGDGDFPTIAESDFFEIWEDKEEDTFVISFNLNGVTVDVERELFPEFARVVADAAELLRDDEGKSS